MGAEGTERDVVQILRAGEVGPASQLNSRFQLRDGRLDRDMEVLGQHTRAFDETWEQPWGERRRVRNHYNEVVVQLGERSGAKRRFEVVFRAFDDGVGFRYRFPEQPGLREAIIDDELTEFAIAPTATAWWIPAEEPIHYEYLYQRTPLEQVPLVHTPITLRSKDGADPMLTWDWIIAKTPLYTGATAPEHPLVSPLFADFSGLPPTLVQTGSEEILLSDSERLAERAEAAGWALELQVWRGMWHDFQMLGDILPEADAALAEIADFVQR